MIGLSPKGILEAVTIFPIMFLIALCMDILEFVLACFGIDDFGILDIVGFAIFGTWVFIRSGGERKITPESRPDLTMAERRKGVQQVQKKATSLLKRLGRVGARAGVIGLIEFIPYVGAIFFGWTMLVIWEAISDLQSFSLEEGQ